LIAIRSILEKYYSCNRAVYLMGNELFSYYLHLIHRLQVCLACFNFSIIGTKVLTRTWARAEKPVTKVLIFSPNDRVRESPGILLKKMLKLLTPVSFEQIEQSLLGGTETAAGKMHLCLSNKTSP